MTSRKAGTQSGGRMRLVNCMREQKSAGQKARIIIHDEPAGVSSPDTVERRARELAVIAGRRANDYTEEDYRQAKQELVTQSAHEDEALETEPTLEPGSGEILGGEARQAENFGSDDESTIGEELVNEGLDEALHDEMYEAGKKEDREEL